MGANDLSRFRRELVTIAEKKEGTVIDVRYNGGGWVSVHLLGILSGETWLLRGFRGEPLTSETKLRSYGYDKPTALLINNHSYSNAEIFAEGWRRMKLGPIVGIPTAGAVIGTDQWTLIDGSILTKPSWGAYTLEGEALENAGRKPDHDVPNDYNDWIDGRDPQLKKAVELLLKETGSRGAP
jgi:tricorn protease